MRAAKTDATQSAIVAELRKRGCSVALTHQVGGGFPDMVVSCNGNTCLVEAKSGTGKLNDEQVKFHELWRGRIYTIRTTVEAAGVAQELRA